MKYLFAFLLVFSGYAFAAPPPVYPGEPGSESDTPIVKFLDTGCLVAWFYDGGHKWNKAGFYGANNDCKEARRQVIDAVGLDPNYIPNFILSYALGWKVSQLSHVQKDQLWDNVFNIYPSDPNYTAIFAGHVENDKYIKMVYDAIPYPTSAPPSGLVTQTTVAYRRQDAFGSNVLTPAGSVPLGTPCSGSDRITNPIGTYHALVDRNKATMLKVGNFVIPRPTTLYGKC